MIERGTRIKYWEGKAMLAVVEERKAAMDLYLRSAWRRRCHGLRAALLKLHGFCTVTYPLKSSWRKFEPSSI
jgi:hypothetical protein